MKNIAMLVSACCVFAMITIQLLAGTERIEVARSIVNATTTAAADTNDASANSNEANPTARGIVYHDKNRNKRYDEGEPLLPGVRVSNGRQIVETDKQGRYALPVDDDTIIFVIKPSGWRTPLSQNLNPEFYYIHKPKGSPANFKYKGVAPTGPLPKSINFPLYPQKEPEAFSAIMFGDPQPRNQKEIDYIAHDVVEGLIGTDAAFGVTLGDILFDDLSLFESQARNIALIGIPWYNVIGNHDINFDAPNDKLSDETFERHYGPAYYAFDYGQVHFLVVDDIDWVVQTPGKRGKYRGGLGKDQLAFIKADLEGVPEEKLVVLMMHIPLVGVHDRQELYRLIEKRPYCISISGHTHHHEHVFIDKRDGWKGPKPHHHIINVTVSGSWWSGAPDERGIPHTAMADGAPNGYSIMRFDGSQYTLDYIAAGRGKDYQMQIHAPEQVQASKAAETDVYVNIFNGSAKSKVQMGVLSSDRAGDKNGEWITMQHTREIDPGYKAVYNAEKNLKGKTWRNMPGPKNSTHLWKAKLPANLKPGTHAIQVRTVDMFSRTMDSRRVVRLTQ